MSLQTIYVPTEYPNQPGWTFAVFPLLGGESLIAGNLVEDADCDGLYVATLNPSPEPDLLGLYRLNIYDADGNFVGTGVFNMPATSVCTVQPSENVARLDFTGTDSMLKSESTNMRGTDGAITSLSGIATAENVYDAADALASHGDNNWATATGFSTHSAADVWAIDTRTLTSFGTLVSDIAAAVWAAATRTLSAFGFTVNTNANSTETAIKAKTDNLPANPAAVGSAMTISGTVQTFDALITQLASDHGAGSWITATGFSTLDAAGIRTAVGLATANLDTQLGNIQSTVDNIELGGVDLDLLASKTWTNSTRTLTQTAQSITDAIDGSSITVHRGDSLNISLSGLGDISSRSEVWFTVKPKSNDPTDDEATIQITETGGLLILNGATAATPGNGTLTVTNEVTGAITITLAASDVATIEPGDYYAYDIQVLYDDGSVSTPSEGDFTVSKDVTRSTS